MAAKSAREILFPNRLKRSFESPLLLRVHVLFLINFVGGERFIKRPLKSPFVIETLRFFQQININFASHKISAGFSIPSATQDDSRSITAFPLLSLANSFIEGGKISSRKFFHPKVAINTIKVV